MDFDVMWRIGKKARSLWGPSTTLEAVIRADLSKFPSCTLDAQKWDFTSSLLNICELPRFHRQQLTEKAGLRPQRWQVPNSTPPLEFLFLALYDSQTAHIRLELSVKCTEDFTCQASALEFLTKMPNSGLLCFFLICSKMCCIVFGKFQAIGVV